VRIQHGPATVTGERVVAKYATDEEKRLVGEADGAR
jgi:hypothetical protein